MDNLKTAMVAWIIAGHALLGYSATGGWAYDEVNEVEFAPGVELALAAVIGPSGLYVIGVFFFLAGLFAPDAVVRVGPRRYARDRLVRLGVPWAVSALLLWPLAVSVAYRAAGWDATPWGLVAHREPLLDSGALWFALVLLIYSLGYAAWVAVRRREPVNRPIGFGRLAGLALVVAAATFAVRLVFPARSAQPGDLHLWQWPQCVAMFAFGVAAARRGWAARTPDRVHRGCAAVVVGARVVTPVVGLLSGVRELSGDSGPYLGGWTPQALLLAAVESVLVVAGSVWLLGLAQRRMTRDGPAATGLARAAFPAFVAQGPVLVLLATALRPAPWPAEGKAPLVAVLGLVVCFAVGALVSRR
ncbi:acyltransferase [Actinokineospora soli]